MMTRQTAMKVAKTRRASARSERRIVCDLDHHGGKQAYGFLVEAAELQALIDETRHVTARFADAAERVEALRPAFAKLLAADGWLPAAYGRPDHSSGMGGGIGQYALYRAEDGSLCLLPPLCARCS